MKRITIEFLNDINACPESIDWFKSLPSKSYTVKYLIRLLFKANHFDWINWGLTHLMNKKQNVMYAVFAVEQVIKIYEEKYPDDDRPRNAIEAVKIYLNNADVAYADVAYANAAYAAYAAAAYADAAYAADAYAADAAAYVAAAAAAAAYVAASYAASAAAAAAAAAADVAVAAAADVASTSDGVKKLQKKIVKYGLKLLMG